MRGITYLILQLKYVKMLSYFAPGPYKYVQET